jgi:DNA-binding MarR family transcriptional regulator
MATASASYRNPQPQPTIEQKEPATSTIKVVLKQAVALTPGQVAQTLDELIELGFIEKFRDEYNITRYRLVARNA